jgi:hypothetical protein
LEALRPQNGVVQTGAARALGRAVYSARRPDIVEVEPQLLPRLLDAYDAGVHSDARAMMLCAAHNVAKASGGARSCTGRLLPLVLAGATGRDAGAAEKVAAYELLEIVANEAGAGAGAGAGGADAWKAVVEGALPLATSALNPLVRRAAADCVTAARAAIARYDSAASAVLKKSVFDEPAGAAGGGGGGVAGGGVGVGGVSGECAACRAVPLSDVVARLRLSPDDDGAALRERLCVCACGCAASLPYPLGDVLAKRVSDWCLAAADADTAERLLEWLSEAGALHRRRRDGGFLSSAGVGFVIAALFVLTGREGGAWEGVRRVAARLMLAFGAPLRWCFHEIQTAALPSALN